MSSTLSHPTTETPQPSDFLICEAVVTPSAVQPDGTVLLHIIRPGEGRGQGNHLYPAEMLRENAEVFTGWKMYVDHETPAQRKARGALPRPTMSLGGRVLEAWWDPTVPPDGDHPEPGAVVGRVRPTRRIRELIEDDPELVEASIAASATSVRPVKKNGKRLWLVEGIQPTGSVDWVSQGGAGGRVALQEGRADYTQEDAVDALDSMTDQELAAYAAGRGLKLQEAAPGGDHHNPPEGGDDDMGKLTPESLREALESDEVKDYVRSLVEAQVTTEREMIRAEVQADADRKLQVRDLRDEAQRLIEASGLPTEFQDRLREEYRLVEGEPTDKLDVYDEVDDEGEISKSAITVLQESLAEDVKDARALIASVKPTRVQAQGGSGPTDLAEGGTDEGGAPKQSFWRDHLRTAGVQDPDKAYDAR